MHYLRTQQSELSNTSSPPSLPGIKTAEQTLTARHAHDLWTRAKKYFYYQDDNAKAASLCKCLLNYYPTTDEADDAKLLLHDIRIEIKRLTEGRSGEVIERNDVTDGNDETQEAENSFFFNTRMRYPLATSVVMLPIIGIAQGGVVGIVLPEFLSLVSIGAAFWIASMIRIFLKKQMTANPRHAACKS